MRLLLDIGNTRWKWMLEDTSKSIATGNIAPQAFADLEKSVKEKVEAEVLEEVLVSSVIADQINQQITDWCVEAFCKQPKYAEVVRSFGGVTVAYPELDKLGVDRWLAMLAGWRKCRKAFMVIGAGSAITIDYVTADGVHQGGLIVPGIGVMRKALFDNTSGVKIESLTLPQKWYPGHDTLSCVENGLYAMLKGFLTEAISIANQGETCLITGGNATDINKIFGSQLRVCEHLVFEGLMGLSR